MIALGTIDLKKTFRKKGQGPVEVLKGVNLSVYPGEKVAIVGRSGAGKSTLLNILGGLLKPTSGTVTRPKNIGFVFQQYHLMPELTVWENVMLPTMTGRLPPADYAARASELLEKAGLSSRRKHLPSELSGGEQQRTAVVRALVTSPEIVLADEPTGNLDAMTGADILRMLADLSRGTGVSLVLVTHSPEAAAVCDRTLRLENGVLVQAGA
ncbi:MAG: ABC transporter ATP-binding protein [Kiritimatiellae bacterium]|nr:ABC transporter ATP-binding protein [Kiritimatiellia bacterium]